MLMIIPFCVLVSAHENVKSKLLLNVNKVVAWFQGNHMKVNPDKCQCIVFGKQDNLGSFKIGDHNILPDDNVEILGLHVDNKLNFNTKLHVKRLGRKVQVLSRLCHVLDKPTKMLLYNSFVECYFSCSIIWHFTTNNNTYKITCQKAGRKVQVLSRLCHVLDKPTKMLLYNSFVECYFSCSIIWHFTTNNNTYKIEKIQKKVLRYITRDFTSSYRNLLNVCKKHPLYMYIVRTRKILETVYKVVNELCPTYLSNLVHVRNKCINFRSKNNLTVPKFNTITHGKESFRYKAPYFWNNLSNNMKNASSLYSFKSVFI